MPTTARQTSAEPHRLVALDSLRFVAAAVVVATHSQTLTPWRGRWPQWAEGLLDARSAVVFFFVLSGFVLHLSWQAAFPEPRAYAGFLVRRVFRIYPLYYLSLALAMAVLGMAPLGDCPLVKNEPAAAGLLAQDHGSPRQWLAHLLLFDPGLDWTFLNPPIWTLNAEMQAALIFPLLSWLIGRELGWRSVLAAGLLLVAGPLLGRFLIPNAGLLPLFALGAVLAAGWERLAGRLSTGGGVLLLATGLWLYAHSELPGRLSYYRDAVAGIGSAAVMLAVLRLDCLRRLLEWRPLAMCGAASYGLYVLHYPLLLALCWAVWKMELPPMALLLAGMAAGLAVALAARVWVEKPMIRFGRKLAARMENR